VASDGVRLSNNGNPVLLDAKHAGAGSDSFYNKLQLPFARRSVLEEAHRQLRAADGLQIEWLVSDSRVRDALEKFFNVQGVNINVKYVKWSP
jgi:hypothetical protein